MAHFAKVNKVTNIVEQVIVATQSHINSLDDSEDWVQTSYNTRSGIHFGEDGNPDGGIALRKNFAGIGYTYDRTLDAFIPPRPTQYPSWILNEETGTWEAPVPYPEDGYKYKWDEDSLTWVDKHEGVKTPYITE